MADTRKKTKEWPLCTLGLRSQTSASAVERLSYKKGPSLRIPRIMHHMTRVRVRGQTQPTHTVHRRVHRPFLGPISLSQPRYPLLPRACSSPRLRVSRTGTGSPSNRMHQQPSSALSRNSRSRTGHSLLLGRKKHRNHPKHVDRQFPLSFAHITTIVFVSRMTTFSFLCRQGNEPLQDM